MEQYSLPGFPQKDPKEHFIPTKGRRITAKQKAFIRFYLETHELAASAIKAGYSKRTAGSIANYLVQKSEVADLIREEEEKVLKQAGLTAQKVLMQLANLANSDVRKLFREDGSLKDPAEWDDFTAAAVSSIEMLEEFAGKGMKKVHIGQVKKVKLWDKPSALEKLGKYFRLWSDKLELSGGLDLKVDLEERLIQAKKKAHGTAG